MKKIIERIIRLRDPEFVLDTATDSRLLFILTFDKTRSLLRGLRLLSAFRKPKFLMLGKGVRFFNIRNISLGRMVKLEDYVFLSGMGKGQLKIGNNSGIGAFSRLVVSTTLNDLGAGITIGNNVGIGEFAYLGGAGGLKIGDESIIGQYFSCHPENHNFDTPGVAIRRQGTTRKGISVGKNCWIGSKVSILDGVSIGDNCVIAAGSVVTKSMPSDVVIGGVPAKVIKSIVSEATVEQSNVNLQLKRA